MTITVSTELRAVHCGECGGTYALDARYHRQKKENGGFWNCPYCQCSWGFPKEASEIERLRREVEKKEREVTREQARHDQTRAELEQTEHRRRAEKGHRTRLQNRIKAGVCPCCKRSFANLAEHMQKQHPEYGGDDD